jgi:hypothetical protein
MPFKSEAQRRYFEANKAKLETECGPEGVGAIEQRFETSGTILKN